MYLSFDHDQLMIGNFIGDFVKGSQLDGFEPDIREGIILHRAIDEYTDTHDVVQQSKERLRDKYRHYSGVIVDVYYDHYLSKNWNDYYEQPLISYTRDKYQLLMEHFQLLPAGAQYMLPYMIDNNWLLNYSKTEGINRALTGMSRRTKFDSKMEEAVTDLRDNYEAFENEFRLFFDDLIKFCKARIAELDLQT